MGSAQVHMTKLNQTQVFGGQASSSLITLIFHSPHQSKTNPAFSTPKAINLGRDKQAQAPGGSTFRGPSGMPRTH